MNKIKIKLFTLFVTLLFCTNISFARIDIVVPAPEDRNKMFSYELYGTVFLPILSMQFVPALMNGTHS